jgi:hypothetical protein
MPNTDTYFHKRLDHCRTETWVPLNLQYFPLRKGTVRRSGWHRPCWIFLYGLDLPTLLRAFRRFAISGQKRRVRRRLPGPHRLSRLLRASAGTRIAYRGNWCSVYISRRNHSSRTKKADIAAMNSRATGVEASKRQKGMSVISD